MKSADYVAVRRLWARKDGKLAVVARPGRSCADVPPESLGWLLAKGWIRKADRLPAEPAHAAAKAKPKGKE